MEDDSNLTETAAEKLGNIVTRVERLEEEMAQIREQRKDVYGEAKALGYDTKAIRTIIKMRKQDSQERQEQEALVEVYMDAITRLPGM